MQKDIQRNRLNKDYDMFLNGRYVGSRKTYQGARDELDRLAMAELTHPLEARELIEKLYTLDQRAA
jgi:hypothetical protein